MAFVVNTPVLLSMLNASPTFPAVIRKINEFPSLSVALNLITFVPITTPSLMLTTGEPGSNSGALSLAFSTAMFTCAVSDLVGFPPSVAVINRKYYS